MRKDKQTHSQNSSGCLIGKMIICEIFFLLMFAAVVASGQEIQTPTDGMTPSGLKHGGALGAYSLSDFENINYYNGNLSFYLPLLKIGGRGAAQHVIGVSANSVHWQTEKEQPSCAPDEQCLPESYYSSPSGWDGYVPLSYSPGVLRGRYSGHGGSTFKNTNPYFYKTLTRLTFTTPDGTEIELRDKPTNGEPMPAGSTVPPYNRGRTFVSSNGSAVTFVSNADIIDERRHAFSREQFYPSGYLLFSDGTRYEISEGLVQWIRDRNGNFLRFIYSNYKVVQIIDSLNRVFNISYTETADTISWQGFGGAIRTIQVLRGSLQSALRPGSGYTIKTYDQLFTFPQGNAGANIQYNPTDTITGVVLPDNRSYNLFYNEYGELARIETPLGAAIEYDYTAPANSIYQSLSGPHPVRRVLERRQYPDGGTGNSYELKQTITPAFSGDGSLSQPYKTTTTVEQFNAEGTPLSKEKHYFEGSPLASLDTAMARRSLYSSWKEGQETKTEIFATNGALLRTTENFYEQREPVAWWSSYFASADYDAPANDRRLVRVETTLNDTNQKTKTETGYDQFNNPTEVKEYDYGTGAFGALLRRTVSTYASAAATINGVDYTCSNCATNFPVYQRRLPLRKSVYDANGTERARTVFEYDNYAADSRHAALVDRTDATALCLLPALTVNGGCGQASTSGYTTRGNLTGITAYGNVAYLTEAALTSAQYDVAGNIVKTIDAKGSSATVSYADNFGSPDGEARINNAPAGLNGLQTFAFATSASNALGWTSYAQYDYHLGAAVDGEDINGIVASGYFNDALDRPTQVINAANNSSFRRQTSFDYNDANRKITTNSDLFTFGDNLAKTEIYYDASGRTTETRTYEANGNYRAVQTEYDVLGRSYKQSNPFRPNEINAYNPLRWTISRFDDLSRVIETETPDGAKVLTNYQGNAVTVTDQAGKQRRSITNALGQLTRVDEPNDQGQLDVGGIPQLPTYYEYDPLGNLKKVTQGVQVRNFYYDSLSRLKEAQNPESGTIQYSYDANGNLTSKTDARNVTTAFAYDALNRVTQRSYSDQTPPVAYTYENAAVTNLKGKLTKVSSSVSTTEYTSFDVLGRVTNHKQTTDGNIYTTGYVYNLSGALIEETYPSGRVVKNVLDTDGDLSMVQSRENANTGFFSYAKNFTYTAAGAVSSMQLGNGSWESTQFNSRLQPTQIALGTVQNATDKLKLNYDYGTTQNNSNVLSQTITVPTVGANTGFTATQSYTYDSLNRLKDAKEMVGATQTWKQTFLYDRYGNRNFDTTNNNTTTIPTGCSTAQCNPSIDTANNRFTTGQGYTYDLAGNLITDAQGRTFTFDAENKQKEVKDANNVSIGTYFYDGDGKRVKKVSNIETTIFVYDASGKLVAEYSNQTNSNPQVSYLTQDHLGSPRITTDANGNVISRRDFMPFGEEIYTAQRTQGLGYTSDNVKQKFTSYERDIESSLDFAEARMYSYSHGRFTSIDPIIMAQRRLSDPQQINLYVYVRNNPLMFTDPTGEDAQGRSEDANGNQTALTEEDRRRLEAQLKRLAPGTSVNADGTVRKAGFWQRVWNRVSGNGVGQELVSGLVNSRQTTTIVVTAGESGSDYDSEVNASNGVGSNATVYWNPNQTAPQDWLMERGSGEEYTANGAAVSNQNPDPAIILGHELIHALHIVSGAASFDRTPTHDFVVRSGNTYETYRESDGGDSNAPPAREEFRTVGFRPYAGRREVTENRLRRELRLPLRVSYFAAQSPYWNCVSCGP